MATPSTVPVVIPNALPALANYENQDTSFWAQRQTEGAVVTAAAFIGGPAVLGEPAPFSAVGVQDIGIAPSMALTIANNNNLERWSVGVAGSENGANSGSDLVITSYNDNGSYNNVAMRIFRTSGAPLFAAVPLYGNYIPLVIPPISGNNNGGLVAPVPPIASGGTVLASLPLNGLPAAQHLSVSVAFKTNNTDGSNNSDVYLYVQTGTASPTSTPKQIGFDIFTPSNGTTFQSGSTILAQTVDYATTDTNIYIVCGQNTSFPNSRIDNWSVNFSVSAN